jgi:hypothetical protein
MNILISIKGRGLLEYLNDVANQEGLPSLELFMYLFIYFVLFIYVVCRVTTLSDGNS